MTQNLKRITTQFIVPLIFLFITLFLCRDLIGNLSSQIENRDGRIVAWSIAWDQHIIQTGDYKNLFDANIFYPNKNSLAYSEHMFGAAIISYPVYLISQNPALVFNLLILLSYFLNSLCTYILVKYLTKSRMAGFIGGLIFGFCAYKIYNIVHLQNLIIFYIPLSLYFQYKFKDTKKRKFILFWTIVMYLQIITSWYHAIFIILMNFLFSAYFFIKKFYSRKDAFKFLLAFLVIGMFTIPFALPYLKLNKETGATFNIGELKTYSADLEGYLLPSFFNLENQISSTLGFKSPSGVENINFVGYVSLSLAILGSITFISKKKFKLDRSKVIFIFVAGIFMILSFGPFLRIGGQFTKIPLPYWFIYNFISPIRFLRAVARYSTVVFLMISILAGFGVVKVIKKARINKFVLVGIISVIIILEFFPTMSVTEFDRVDNNSAIYNEVKNNPNIKAIVELPILPKDSGDLSRSDYYAAIHFKPVFNGLSGYSPIGYGELAKDIDENINSERIYDKLKTMGITDIVVYPEFTQNLDPKFYSEVKSEGKLRLFEVR